MIGGVGEHVIALPARLVRVDPNYRFSPRIQHLFGSFDRAGMIRRGGISRDTRCHKTPR